MRGCRVLTESEIESVSKHLSLRDRALFITGIRTGFRITELLSLRVGDVWDGKQVRDAIQVRKQNLKGRSPTRCIALHDEAKHWISELIVSSCLQSKVDSPLFYSRKGGSLDRKSAWRILSSAFRLAGLKGLERQLGTHTMRKTFANRVYDRLGRDLVKTQRALGHATINSTAQYLSFDEEEITNAILGRK